MSPLSLQSVLGRASTTDFEAFSDIAVIELITSETSSTLAVAKTLCDVYTPEAILLDGKGRMKVLEFMKEEEISAYFSQLGHENIEEAHVFASTFHFNSEAEDSLLSFFGLERTVIEEVENSVKIEQQCDEIEASYGLFGHQLEAAIKTNAILKTDRGRVLLHMPTGSGKTRTAMHIVAEHLNSEIIRKEKSLSNNVHCGSCY